MISYITIVAERDQLTARIAVLTILLGKGLVKYDIPSVPKHSSKLQDALHHVRSGVVTGDAYCAAMWWR